MTEIYSPRDWATQPPYLYPDYKSTVLRAPRQPLIPIRQSLSELTGRVYGHRNLQPLDADLTRNAVKTDEPIGERIVVTGRVLDENGRPQPDTLIEIWQANAAGRYVHVADQHPAPLDPNFLRAGRCLHAALFLRPRGGERARRCARERARGASPHAHRDARRCVGPHPSFRHSLAGRGRNRLLRRLTTAGGAPWPR